MTSISITAADLANAFTADLDTIACKSAEELIAQGWTAEPGAYDIGAISGDLEAAEDYAGRKLNRDEVKEHEARIRAHLGRMLGAE